MLLEALWGFYVAPAQSLGGTSPSAWEIAWLDHQHNDFACIPAGHPWKPTKGQRVGEFFRIEAKSMRKGAAESKGHFTELRRRIDPLDLLLVLIWKWTRGPDGRRWPRVMDYYLGPAKPIAQLRDRLHRARGGRFVNGRNCPDGCVPTPCKHHGEPLNAAGHRERSRGPKACTPAGSTSGTNFGGLVRMLRVRTPRARRVLRLYRAAGAEADRFIRFIHKNFPKEEFNCYSAGDWKTVAAALQISTKRMNKADVVAAVRARPNYIDILRQL